MIKRWLIDTDVLIDYLRGYLPSALFLEKIIEDSACYLSMVTVAELYAGIREGKERQLLEKFLLIFELVSIDADIARIGGLYRRDYGKSHNVGLADAIIAASTESCGATLVTLNKKHFPMLKKLQVPYAKS